MGTQEEWIAYRSRLKKAEASLKQAEKKFRAMEGSVAKLNAELRSVKNDREAVKAMAQRNEAYKTAIEQFFPVKFDASSGPYCSSRSAMSIITSRIGMQFTFVTGRPANNAYGSFPIRDEVVSALMKCPDGHDTVRLHKVPFSHTTVYPDAYYVSCECGFCTGVFYRTPFEAISAWNECVKDTPKGWKGE